MTKPRSVTALRRFLKTGQPMMCVEHPLERMKTAVVVQIRGKTILFEREGKVFEVVLAGQEFEFTDEGFSMTPKPELGIDNKPRPRLVYHYADEQS